MKQLREAATKRVPFGHQIRVRKLAQTFDMSPPISLRTLVNVLDSALPDFVVFDSGPLGPSTTTGEAQIRMTIDGQVSFTGKVHESGGIGHNYVFAMLVDAYHDSAGNALVFVHKGSVNSPIDEFGSPDDPWNLSTNPDPFITENWVVMKTSSTKSNLEVSTSLIDALGVAVSLGDGVSKAIKIIKFIGDASQGDNNQTTDTTNE